MYRVEQELPRDFCSITRELSLPHSVQTVTTHLAWPPKGTGSAFPETKATSFGSTEGKNAWSYTATPPYVFTVRCSITDRGNFTFTVKYFFIYSSVSLQHFVEPWPFLQFRNFFTQTVGLLGREISLSQGRYLNTGQHKHRIKTHRHPCLEWDSNPRSQRSSQRRRCQMLLQ
jgi:hypothetical protein